MAVSEDMGTAFRSIAGIPLYSRSPPNNNQTSISILTAIVEVVYLISAITPNLLRRTELIEQFIPFNIWAGGHDFAAISGLYLINSYS